MPNASIPAIQQFQMPDPANTAARFLQLKALRQQGQNAAVLGQQKFGLEQQKFQAGQQEAQNAALLKQQKFQAEQASTKRKNSIEVNDFALNLLSGVNSPEDLEIAKGQFNARYPQFADMTSKIMADYSPQKVEMIRNSLRTETQRLKTEDLEWERENKLEGFGAGTAIYKGGKPMGQVPFAPTKPSAPKFEVFSDSGGNQVYVEKGKPIPEGYSKVQTKGTQVTIQNVISNPSRGQENCSNLNTLPCLGKARR
jgi:hypothetical protein